MQIYVTSVRSNGATVKQQPLFAKKTILHHSPSVRESSAASIIAAIVKLGEVVQHPLKAAGFSARYAFSGRGFFA